MSRTTDAPTPPVRLAQEGDSAYSEGPCPKPGEIRVINGRRCRFIERELEGDKWEVLEGGPPVTLPMPLYPFQPMDASGGTTFGSTADASGIWRETADASGRDAPPQPKGEVEAAVAFMEKAAVMLGRGEMPAPGTKYAADWYLAHRSLLSALTASQAREARAEAGGDDLAARLRRAETWDLDADQEARDRCGVLMLEAADCIREMVERSAMLEDEIEAANLFDGKGTPMTADTYNCPGRIRGGQDV